MLKSLPEIKNLEPGASGESGRAFQFNPIRSLKLHPFLAAGIMSFILAAGLPIAYLRSEHKYSSEALLSVAPAYTKNVRGDQENYQQYSTFVSQQIASIGRFDILAAAIKRTEGKPYAWRLKSETEREAVERLRRLMVVRHIPETYLVSIALSGENRSGLAELLNGVAEIAVANASNDAFFGRTDRVDSLNREKAQLESDLGRMNGELSQLSGSLGMVSIDKGASNPDDKIIAGARVELEEARRHRMEAQTRYLLLEGESEQSKTALASAAAEAMKTDSSLVSTVNPLMQKQAELRASALGMSAIHPSRKNVDRELAELDEQIVAARNAAREKAEKQILDSAKAELDRDQALESQLDGEYRDRLKRVTGLSQELQSATSLQLEIDETRSRLSTVKERIDYLTVEGSGPGPLRIFSAAQAPLRPDPGTRKKLFLVVFGLSLALAVGSAMASDLLDKTVRDTSTVEQVFGFAPAGLVLERRSHTKDFATEQFLRLVSGVERARQNFQARTFVFSGIKPGSGTTRIVEDVARELKAHGLRVLKIEANAYRPDPRYSISANVPGLADILTGRCRPQEAVQHGGSLSPDWISIGNTKGRPRLPGCHRLGPVLDQLASEYDVVLVDSAPLLLSSDTEAIVGLASATMLVVRANSDTSQHLRRANRLLRRLEPGAVGCVLNRVEIHRAGEGLQQEFAEYTQFRKAIRTPEHESDMHVPEMATPLGSAAQKLLAQVREQEGSGDERPGRI